jgi:hypothetical protein
VHELRQLAKEEVEVEVDSNAVTNNSDVGSSKTVGGDTNQQEQEAVRRGSASPVALPFS